MSSYDCTYFRFNHYLQQRYFIGNWQLAAGTWRLAAGGWQLAAFHFSFFIFHFLDACHTSLH